MEYEQMLAIGEDYLTSKVYTCPHIHTHTTCTCNYMTPHLQGVTKGARTKIILSIRKIARRPETLVEIEQVRTYMTWLAASLTLFGPIYSFWLRTWKNMVG